jgi:uncharacterized protein
MKNITEWIKRHPVAAFFFFAFVITWPIEILALFILPGNQLLLFFGQWALFGPALAAMLISGIEQPQPKVKRRRLRWIAFLLSWLLSALALILYGWKVMGMELIVSCIANGILAIVPAWVLSSAYARTPGVRKQFSTLLRPRGPAIWYLAIFLIYPGISLLAMGVMRLVGGDVHYSMAITSFGGAVILVILEFLHVFLLTGGINEEPGWRGFALPRLQARYPVIVSALIVWLFWVAWHLPLDIAEGAPIGVILYRRLISNLIISILFAWIYNRTNGSILAPVLFHSVMNAFDNQVQVIGSQTQAYFNVITVVTLLLAIAIVVLERMWKRLPAGSLAAFRTIAELPDELAGSSIT